MAFNSYGDDMAVDQADSLDFSEFHQSDKIKLIDSDQPQHPVNIGRDDKNINAKQHTVTSSYSNSQGKDTAMVAVETLAAERCHDGWREIDQWISRENDIFIINYKFRCRQSK
jgi:hypothetical protein